MTNQQIAAVLRQAALGPAPAVYCKDDPIRNAPMWCGVRIGGGGCDASDVVYDYIDTDDFCRQADEATQRICLLLVAEAIV